METIIAEEVERCCQRQAGMAASHAIVSLRQAFERIRRAELERLAPVLAELAPEHSQAVDAMTHAMINKLLHTPTVRLKEMLVVQTECRPHELLCELFTGNEEGTR